MTTIRRWLDSNSSTNQPWNGWTSGTWIEAHTWYDQCGNPVKVRDSNNFDTVSSYADNFYGLEPQNTYAYLTSVTTPGPALTTITKYDFSTGLIREVTDPNDVKTRYDYNDPLDRLTQTVRAEGTSVQNQMTIQYDDINHIVTTTGDRDTFGDNLLKSEVVYDGLRRTVESRKYETASSFIAVNTVYDALGRPSQVSNPRRSGDTELWTTTEYDSLGRPIKVTTPDGAHVDTAYSGNQVTVTDQAGKKRSSQTDALGRLVKVTEDPGTGKLNYDTTYFYDPLGNLRAVNQGGQGRWFSYDSLSRLIRAGNPEQICNQNLPQHIDPITGGGCWSTAYSYDANGNLVSKTDARNITTNYTYDALNRNTTVDYSNTADNPDIWRFYDNPNLGSYGKGRFHATCAGGDFSTGQQVECTTIDHYDALGRPRAKIQQFKSNGVWNGYYSISSTYDLAGNVKTVTYPSDRTVNYSYDQAGRLSGFSGNLGGSPKTYADTISYNAAGQMIKERFGTNTSLYHNLHYNNRMQLVAIHLGDSATDEWNRNRGGIDFLYGTTAVASGDYFANDTDNNGNLRRQINWVPLAGGGVVSPQCDDYYYDALNRISSFTEAQMISGGQWTFVASQNFSYDRWGNRKITSATGGVNNYNPTYDPTYNTNRIVGLGYDEAGNITSDPMTGGLMVYDGENRMLTATNGGLISSFTYDADGNRVRKIVGALETRYIYGIGGELVAEYAPNTALSAPQKEYGYRNGQLLVVWDGSETGDRQLQWLVQDHLGSTRMVVDRSGSLGGVRRHDFAPFGEELFAGGGIRSASNGYGGDSVRQKYTGQERDDETGLDFAQARYYANAQGRFTSTDPIAMAVDRLGDPQRINLYSYTRNNPLSLIDPTGETIQVDKDAQEAYDEYLKALNKDPKKYSNELATINRLTNSKVNYVIKLGTKGFSETAEGNVLPDNNGNIVVGIRNIGGASGEKYDLNGRFAHELEHARQFDAGEIAFGRDAKTGNWFAYPSVYDVMDEVKAFNAQVNVAPPAKDTTLLRSLRDDRISDDDRARILLSSGYSHLKDRGRNLNYRPYESLGKKPGEIVRTSQFYGVVHSVIKSK